MKVSNHANHNNDGLDSDGCRRVIIRNCEINSEDDAMCIKGASLRPTEDVLIEGITGQGNFRQGSLISGTEGGLIEDVVIRRVNIGMAGGGTEMMARAKVKDEDKGYPDAQRFSRGGLPAHGFYIRHAQRVRFEEIQVTPASADARPPMAVGRNAKEISFNGSSQVPQSITD